MQLRPYQMDAVDAAWEAITKRKANPLIVAPTGSGKSVMIAELVARNARERGNPYGGGQAIVLAHRKELLLQNAEKLGALLPDHKIGIYSAGLRSREFERPIVVAGIQSVWNRAELLGSRDLVVIDEAHLVSSREGTRYQKFLRDLAICSPGASVVGLTATPFRTSEGAIICEDQADNGGLIFSEIAHEIEVRPLIEAGYLANLTNRATSTVDMTGVPIRQGEFVAKHAEARWIGQDVVERNISELVPHAIGRKKVLIFCSGVDHAMYVREMLASATGEMVEIVDGMTSPPERSRIIDEFRNGSLRWLVNIDVLTTGFDSPNIDAIGILRATWSPGLFAQMCGRGFRIAPGKSDCLILDFGGNIERHGALDHPEFGRTGSGAAEAINQCEQCGTYWPKEVIRCKVIGHRGYDESIRQYRFIPDPSGEDVCETPLAPWECIACQGKNARDRDRCGVMVEATGIACGCERTAKRCPECDGICSSDDETCPACGYVFDDEKRRTLKHLKEASDRKNVLLYATAPKDAVRMLPVVEVALARHVGRAGKLDTLKVTYEIEVPDSNEFLPRFHREWLCVEHTGFPRTKFARWWMEHSSHPVPTTIDEAIAIWGIGGMRIPSRITVVKDDPYWRVDRREFEEERPNVIALTENEIANASKGAMPWDDLPF